jgi:hypothetical protein
VTDAAASPTSEIPSAPAVTADDWSGPPDRPPVRHDRLELASAVVLALATVLAAWSAYQATRWGGEQSKASGQAAAKRVEAAQDTSLFAAEAIVDTQLFIAWLEVQRTPDGQEMAAFFEERFREEFKPAFEAWLAQVPAGGIPPGTPFEMDAYESATADVVMGLISDAEALTEEARRSNQLADNFVLITVIMATVLFFAGVVGHFKDRRLGRVLLGFAVLLLTGGIAFMLSMPQSFSV